MTDTGSLLVLNRADSKVGLSISEVEKTMGHAIGVQIPSSRDVPATVNRGVPIVLDDPKHPVSRAIHQVAESVVDGFAVNSTGTEGEEPAKRGRRGRRAR